MSEINEQEKMNEEETTEVQGSEAQEQQTDNNDPEKLLDAVFAGETEIPEDSSEEEEQIVSDPDEEPKGNQKEEPSGDKQEEVQDDKSESEHSPEEWVEHRKLRKHSEEQDKKLADMQKELEELKAAKKEETEAAQQGNEEVTGQVLGLMNRARIGELTADELARHGSPENAQSRAATYLTEHASASELEAILINANKGGYGENSDEIATIAARFLPLAERREAERFRNDYKSEQETKTQTEKIEAERNDGIARAMKELKEAGQPDFTEIGSEQHDFLMDWTKKNVMDVIDGVTEKSPAGFTKSMAQFLYDNPYDLVQEAARRFKPPVQSELEKTQAKKLAEYEKKLRQLDALPASSAPVSPNQANKEKTAGDLEKELDAMFAGG